MGWGRAPRAQVSPITPYVPVRGSIRAAVRILANQHALHFQIDPAAFSRSLPLSISRSLHPPPSVTLSLSLSSLLPRVLQEEAQSAIQELNGTELGSRQIEVREDSKTGGGGGSYPKAGNAKAGATAAAAASADPVGATAPAAPAASAAVAPISTTS